VLHQHPELSGREVNTAKRIIDFVSEYHPSKIVRNLGGYGVAVTYEFGTNGPTVVIRCELDALPITEKNSFAHQSNNKDVSHKCGHDEHMAIVAGLAPWLQNVRFKKGKVDQLLRIYRGLLKLQWYNSFSPCYNLSFLRIL
jgi:metal-dependent amidase/aminoacylase/carboxypeptidase family protein